LRQIANAAHTSGPTIAAYILEVNNLQGIAPNQCGTLLRLIINQTINSKGIAPNQCGVLLMGIAPNKCHCGAHK
jgi:hypothetical protein